MRTREEKKIVLRKDFPNGNFAVREFVTQRSGIDVQILRIIEVTNGNRSRTIREFHVCKEFGNMVFKNNLAQGFKIINN